MGNCLFQHRKQFQKGSVKRLKTDMCLFCSELSGMNIMEIDAMWRLLNCWQQV